MTMRSLVFDIETDDLKATKVWCIVAQDLDSNEIFRFAPHQLESGLELLQSADRLIGHNIIGFDIPVIKKLLGVDLSNKIIVDTLVLSRLFNPSRQGGHGLEMWGFKVGYSKIEFDDYANYSEEMMKYCVRDVQLNRIVYYELKEESKGFSKESKELEHGISAILKKQEADGFLFDRKKAEELLADFYKRMNEAEEEVHKVFKPKMVDVKEVTPYIRKDGKLSKRGLSDEEYEKCFNTGNHEPFMRQKLEDFNLSSRSQIAERLQEFGWKPTEFTAKGQAKCTYKILDKIEGIPEAKVIRKYQTLEKVIAQIKSWVKAIEEDERIHGFVVPNGTITGRMTHRNPNMAQCPKKPPYGMMCRECWIVPRGYKLVGIDASGLEGRMLAHYMKDEDYINEIIKHGDIHKRNQQITGLKSRDQSKSFLYSLIYGAGNAKLGSVVGGSAKDGKRLRENFFADKPKFTRLRDRVTKASWKGYLKALDGRRIIIRERHSSLNFLLQSAGSIVMKRALIILDDEAQKQKLDYKFVANIHDEWQVEVKTEDAEQFGSIGVQAIRDAGEYYNMNCPLDGEYKIGDNWSETH